MEIFKNIVKEVIRKRASVILLKANESVVLEDVQGSTLPCEAKLDSVAESWIQTLSSKLFPDIPAQGSEKPLKKDWVLPTVGTIKVIVHPKWGGLELYFPSGQNRFEKAWERAITPAPVAPAPSAGILEVDPFASLDAGDPFATFDTSAKVAEPLFAEPPKPPPVAPTKEPDPSTSFSMDTLFSIPTMARMPQTPTPQTPPPAEETVQQGGADPFASLVIPPDLLKEVTPEVVTPEIVTPEVVTPTPQPPHEIPNPLPTPTKSPEVIQPPHEIPNPLPTPTESPEVIPTAPSASARNVTVSRKILDHSDSLMVICSEDPSFVKSFSQKAFSFGCQIQQIADPDIIMKLTESTSPKFLVLDERDSNFKELHKVIYNWQTEFRIPSTVILVSNRFPSGHSPYSFAQSVDMIVALEELDRWSDWATKALDDKAQFLKMWKSE